MRSMKLSYCRGEYRLRINRGVITKFLQDKDSLHCIALFNVPQLYENLKNKQKKQTKNKQKNKQDKTLLTQPPQLAEIKTFHFEIKPC